MAMLDGKQIVLGVTGGIAAFKACSLIRRLMERGAAVQVVMTQHATEFVTPLTFQTLSGRSVAVDLFTARPVGPLPHIDLAKWAHILVIAPATANIIGKIAAGIADDLLSTLVMATESPVVLAPAMNANMYSNPIVQQNIEKLRALGYRFVEPEEGILASGDRGVGRLAKLTAIIAEIEAAISGEVTE